MQFQIIDSEAGLRALSQEWTQLVDNLPAAVPFQLPLWLLTWWKHFGSGELQTLTFRADGELQAVIPLFRHLWNSRRQLTLLGSGISDWTDPPMKTDVVSGIHNYLVNDANWNVLDWQDLSADAPLRGLPDTTVQVDVQCSEVPLRGSFVDFWNSRSKDLRRNLRRYAERARERGPLTFHVCRNAQPELLDELIRLHELRWQKLGEPGMIAANHAEEFLRDIAAKFSEAGMLRLFVLRWSGAIVAIIMGFAYRNKIFSYLSALHPENETLGFGRTLMFESLRYCFEEGYTAWNFLRGDEPYKASWGAEPIPKIRLYKAR